MNLTKEDFLIMGVKEGNISPFLTFINEYFEKYSINEENAIKYGIANILHETNNFKALVEIGGGKESYDGGTKFCGRGLPQLTHIRNYRAFRDWLKSAEGIVVDIILNPSLVATDPKLAVLAFVWFWNANGLSELARQGKFLQICAIWNTGNINNQAEKINGWADRLKKLEIVEKWIQIKMNDLM